MLEKIASTVCSVVVDDESRKLFIYSLSIQKIPKNTITRNSFEDKIYITLKGSNFVSLILDKVKGKTLVHNKLAADTELDCFLAQENPFVL